MQGSFKVGRIQRKTGEFKKEKSKARSYRAADTDLFGHKPVQPCLQGLLRLRAGARSVGRARYPGHREDHHRGKGTGDHDRAVRGRRAARQGGPARYRRTPSAAFIPGVFKRAVVRRARDRADQGQ